MQPAQKLTRLLRELLTLVEDEAAQNPAFAERLAAITEGIAQRARTPSKQKVLPTSESLPDVFIALQDKGDEEFRFWLRSFDLQTLKAIVRINGFDPGKASRRWTETDKFVCLIAEQAAARLRRGASFLPPKTAKDNGGTPQNS